jgi:chloramphenicol-sensitive protein RarD
MLWSLLFLGLVLTFRRQWTWLGQALRRPRVVGSFIASALLLSVNWFTYIWAVNHGHVIDASLGYFLTPLVNVTLGYALLHERLRRGQWLSIFVAACGVVWLALQAGQLPWIAMLLAATFGGYGLLRKTAALGALEGLSFETLILFPLAFAYLGWLMLAGTSAFIATDSASTRALLVAAGPITAIPLLLFAAGARQIPLSVLGLLQYIAPTIQLLLGIWLFNETFSAQRMVGFIIIWSALALYALEGLWQRSRTA